MSDLARHLPIVPIVLPLLASAAMLLFDERRRVLKRVVSLGTTALLIVAAILLATGVTTPGGPAAQVYRVGDWAAPFGIVLVADRLSVLMVLLASVLGFLCLLYAVVRWDRMGPRFHSLYLLLLMGVNGAFLTGDIFNLFVFFEVLLAASYGLALHGGGVRRTSAGLHYITFNIATSLLFLIGVSMIYSVVGSLNMADLAVRIRRIDADDLAILEAGAAILGTAFLVKAGLWPLSFWLPTTYAAAAPPVAALFAVMSKVGVYVVLRLSALLFGADAGGAAHFADEVLVWASIATIGFGIVGILATRMLTRLAGYYILVSSGILLATIGSGGTAAISSALLYLVTSTLAVGAFYLLVEPLERGPDGQTAPDAEAVFDDEYTGSLAPDGDEVGVVIPGSVALLGGGFMLCVLLMAGLPPLSGFIAKFAIIAALLDTAPAVGVATWTLIALILVSGLAIVIALSRAGIDLLWTTSDEPLRNVHALEAVPIGLLLALCLALVIGAGPAMEYLDATASSLAAPNGYIDAVLGQR